MKKLLFSAFIAVSIGVVAQTEEIRVSATDSMVVNSDGHEINLYGEGSTLEGFHDILHIEADYIRFNKETGELYSSGIRSVKSSGLTVIQEESFDSQCLNYLYYNKADNRVYISQKPKW